MPDWKGDLQRSGLDDAVIEAMQIRPVTAAECQRLLGWDGPPANGGYLIPYFDLDGKRTDFYRIRFVPPLPKPDGGLIRYAQPKGSTTRAYLPPLPECKKFWRNKIADLIITEGEKKAAKACQEGILAVGLGGVNSWLRRKFEIDAKKITPHPTKEGKLILELLDAKEIRTVKERVAEELIDLPLRGRRVLICFDNDRQPNVRVQQAAFDLACWLEEQDVTDVEQVLLPDGPEGEKLGLDDYLISHNSDEFYDLPRWRVEPEYLKGWLREQLKSAKKLDRIGKIACARAVSNSLLNHGTVFKDEHTTRYYYHSNQENELDEFEANADSSKHIVGSEFGSLLHRSYGLGSSDAFVLNRSIENLVYSPGLRYVTPRRASYADTNALYFQIGDGQLLRTTADAIEILPNGTDGVLFLPCDGTEVCESSLKRLIEASPDREPYWLRAVKELVTLQPLAGMSLEETRLFLAAECYLNPWFRRWRGLALPIEIFLAEPNSGKSYLLMLRRGILTGKQDLDLMSEDKGDWHANITHAPGMWACDNIDLISRDMERTFSDALCHFVTQDDPKVSMRKLYATNVRYQARVDCTFAFTCIRNPFYKPDIIQRSFTFHLKAIPEDKRQSGWVDSKLEHRVAWVYDQMRVSQRFLQAANEHWKSTGDRPSTRLKHFDQALHLMGIALGRSEEMDALIPKLRSATQEAIAEADPAMSMLRDFAREMRFKGKIGAENRVKPTQAKDIIERAGERFSHVRILKSVEAFGKYLAQHETDILNSCGIRRQVEKNQTWLIVEDRTED